MTGFTKIILAIGGLIILVLVICAMYIVFLVWGFIHIADRQMNAGKKYMDSLTDKDIQAWIQRTQKYLQEDNPKDIRMDARIVPPELKQLKIIRIDEQPNKVDYVWMGVFDSTELDVERMSNGNFQFIAVYTDESNRVIWPKQ